MKAEWVIALPRMKIRAFHGIHDFEKQDGNDFLVSVKVYPEIESTTVKSLDATIDYENLYKIIHEEMETPAELMEEVVKRIGKRILADHVTCTKIEVSISKLLPETMPGCESADVTLTLSR